ncbi:hypothetical protein CRE_05141 [Caenorhabditis remanei]|uniref:Uncharacterized protein n=1 Tax=Caenorhabditis remanei TaxID=31234 RepID=E3N6A2_CAERE|nr:hypothetical protein CRE_05141 [Caenorhabditis remanei]
MSSQEQMRILKTKAIMEYQKIFRNFKVRHHATTQLKHHYPVQKDQTANPLYYELPPPLPATNQLFQPMPQQNFVAPQPRDSQNCVEQNAGDADTEYQSPPLQQQQVHPIRQRMRPVVAARPFSIGRNKVEYAESRMLPRGVSVAPCDSPQFRFHQRVGSSNDGLFTTTPRNLYSITVVTGEIAWNSEADTTASNDSGGEECAFAKFVDG